jgi:hypothetical protein
LLPFLLPFIPFHTLFLLTSILSPFHLYSVNNMAPKIMPSLSERAADEHSIHIFFNFFFLAFWGGVRPSLLGT